MRFHILKTIYLKEMIELLRDRRTLISMVLLPLIAFPAIFAVMGKVMSMTGDKAKTEANDIAVPRAGIDSDIRTLLEGAGFKLVPQDDLRKAIEDKTTAAAVETTGPIVKVYTDQTRQASDIAGDRVRDLLGEYKTRRVKEKLAQSGVAASVLEPITIARVNVASGRKMGGFVLGSMLGYIVVLLMFSGGMYPAIDMTAGERERKTMETYLASPARRGEIVGGKILATVTATYLTALLTLGSMFYSVKSGGFMNTGIQSMVGSIPLDLTTVGWIVLTLLPVAIMAGSIMIAIACFARSFKEAQSYLTPLIMLVIFPALLGGLPGMELRPALCFIPIFNATQLIKSILQGDFQLPIVALTFAANLLYAAIAGFIAVRIFKSEGVLFRT